jgi:hypothetical protein
MSGDFSWCPCRGYTSFSQALDEIIDSRVWGGIHWRTADVQGAELGMKVARWERIHQANGHTASEKDTFEVFVSYTDSQTSKITGRFRQMFLGGQLIWLISGQLSMATAQMKVTGSRMSGMRQRPSRKASSASWLIGFHQSGSRVVTFRGVAVDC